MIPTSERPELMELPPRARRIPDQRLERSVDRGTTSACAENTWVQQPHYPCTRNYLRVRGEYSTAKPISPKVRELPPRARRIPEVSPASQLREGTTSACAENTSGRGLRIRLTRNYLRVRGEYRIISESTMLKAELPPRARRILSVTSWLASWRGTTSACAENTLNELGLL